EDAVRPRRLEHHHDRVAQPEVLAHPAVELHGRVPGGDQGVAVRAELQPQQAGRREQRQGHEGEDGPPRMVDGEIGQPVEPESGPEERAETVEDGVAGHGRGDLHISVVPGRGPGRSKPAGSSALRGLTPWPPRHLRGEGERIRATVSNRKTPIFGPSLSTKWRGTEGEASEGWPPDSSFQALG